METAVTAKESFEELRTNYWPIFCDVFSSRDVDFAKH